MTDIATFWQPLPPQQPTVAPPPAAATASSISVAAVNPHLFLNGFRLRVCPTKPIPWDIVRDLDFSGLRLQPPDLNIMKDLTLGLVDAQLEAETIFGETTVNVRGGGSSQTVVPRPSVKDVVCLAKSLQAALQFHLHSIQALRDQVRKQSIINNNFEQELRRVTVDHVAQSHASAKSRDVTVSALEDRLAKFVEENTKLKQQLATAESRVKEMQVEQQTSLLAWKEERMKINQENYSLRQFVSGHGGGLDSEEHKALMEYIRKKHGGGGGGGDRDVDSKKRRQSSSSHHHRHHHRHHADPSTKNYNDDGDAKKKSSSSGTNRHSNGKTCDKVSCSKCGRGSLRPIPFAIINQALPEGQASNLAPPVPAPKKPSADTAAVAADGTLPVHPPSAMEQLRMQDVIDKNKKGTDSGLNRIESLVRQQGDEFRNSMKVVEDVAHRSLKLSGEADARQQNASANVTNAMIELKNQQHASETRVLAVISQTDGNVRTHIGQVGDALKSETRRVSGQVGELSKRVASLEYDVVELKKGSTFSSRISPPRKPALQSPLPDRHQREDASPSAEDDDANALRAQQQQEQVKKPAPEILPPNYLSAATAAPTYHPEETLHTPNAVESEPLPPAPAPAPVQHAPTGAVEMREDAEPDAVQPAEKQQPSPFAIPSKMVVMPMTTTPTPTTTVMKLDKTGTQPVVAAPQPDAPATPSSVAAEDDKTKKIPADAGATSSPLLDDGNSRDNQSPPSPAAGNDDGGGDSEAQSTTDDEDTFQARMREKRRLRKQQEADDAAAAAAPAPPVSAKVMSTHKLEDDGALLAMSTELPPSPSAAIDQKTGAGAVSLQQKPVSGGGGDQTASDRQESIEKNKDEDEDEFGEAAAAAPSAAAATAPTAKKPSAASGFSDDDDDDAAAGTPPAKLASTTNTTGGAGNVPPPPPGSPPSPQRTESDLEKYRRQIRELEQQSELEALGE